MKPVLYIFALCAFLLHIQTAKAQKENNIWCFYRNIGIDFNTNPPTFFSHNMQTNQGCSTVSDENGHLLFYTSGVNVWDKNGNLMPHGQGLLGNGPVINPPTAFYAQGMMGSSGEGVSILKSTSNENQYYLFVADPEEDTMHNVYYSLIDMSLNGGMGDVVSNQKNIMFDTALGEQVLITKGDDCASYWIVTHGRLTGEYHAFKFDQNGLHPTPVISMGAAGAAVHPMQFSKNGKFLLRFGYPQELCQFDRTTGQFSTPTNLILFFSNWAFSPDETKLYCNGMTGLIQLDLTGFPNATTILNSTIHISDSSTGPMRLIRDKICIYSFEHYLDMIDMPDLPGVACQFHTNIAGPYPSPASPSFNVYELGNPVIINKPIDSVITSTKDTVCYASAITLSATSIRPFYRWNTEEHSSSITVNQTGKYWVRGIKDCTLYIDSFDVLFVNAAANLGPDTSICKGDSFLLNTHVTNATYKWQDGGTQQNYSVSDEGTYAVAVNKLNCHSTDTIKITVIDPYLKIKEPDTAICTGAPLILHAQYQPESLLQWNTGSSNNTTNVRDSGIYIIKASNKCGVFYDSVKIEKIECDCNAFMPSAFTPNNDGNNDIAMARIKCDGMTQFMMRIYNRYGQQLFQSNNINSGWDGTFNGKRCELGTYFYYLEYKNHFGQNIKKKGDIALLR